MANEVEKAEVVAAIRQEAGVLLEARGLDEANVQKMTQQIGEAAKAAETVGEFKEALSKLEQSVQQMFNDQEAVKRDSINHYWENDSHLRLMATGNPYDEMELTRSHSTRLYHKIYALRGSASQRQEAQRQIALLDEAQAKTAEHIKQAGAMQVMSRLGRSVEERHRKGNPDKASLSHLEIAQRVFREAWTTGNADQGGDNFLPDVTDAMFWADTINYPTIWTRIPARPMMTDTVSIRRWTTAVHRGYKLLANTAQATEQTPADANYVQVQQMTAFEAIDPQFIAQSVIEDSDVPMPSELEAELMNGARNALNAIAVSGDTAAVGSNINRNADGSAIGADDVRRAADGFRKFALSNSAYNTALGTSITTASLNTARALLKSAGVLASGHFFVMPESVYFDALSLESFFRVDAAGQLSTLMSGALPRVGMGAIEVADDYIYADPVASNGQVSSTVGDNTVHSFVVVAPELWRVGIKAIPAIFAEDSANPVGVKTVARFRAGLAYRGQGGRQDGRGVPAGAVINIS